MTGRRFGLRVVLGFAGFKGRFAAWLGQCKCGRLSVKRGVTAWQLVAGIEDAKLMRERPRSKPNPSVVLQQQLADGSEVEAIWAWLAESKRAMLVTVYFRE
jgi:hypothetical protein